MLVIVPLTPTALKFLILIGICPEFMATVIKLEVNISVKIGEIKPLLTILFFKREGFLL